MKNLFLFISIMYFSNGFAQDPDPELFRTWYLTYVLEGDGGSPYVVSEIEPAITPYITISENLEFSGAGACNSFNGLFNIEDPDYIQTLDFSYSTNDCGINIHNSFENEYFAFINVLEFGGPYQITSSGNTLFLNINTTIFGGASFRSSPLSLSNYDLRKVEVYPNPSSSKIFIKEHHTTIKKIELLNMFGQKVKSIYNDFESVDISEFSTGIYMMKIFSNQGVLTKKIIKE